MKVNMPDNFLYPVAQLGYEEVGDGMADSFFMIPSKSEAPLATLKKENAALKAQVEAQQAKLVAAERMMKQRQEQDQQLRGSIMLARKEVNCSAR